jgi:hypothetical protein
MGAESSMAAIAQSQQLGLNIIANYYLVILVRFELHENAVDYQECQRIEQMVSNLISTIQMLT